MDEQELADLRARIEAVRGEVRTGDDLAAQLRELVGIGVRIEELEKLAEFGQESCWVCDTREQRASMQPEPVGEELWWTCSRCEQRRQNAERMGVLWPANVEAWWKRWAAEQRAAGQPEDWLVAVRDQAWQLMERDPTVLNFGQATLKVAEVYGR